LKQERFGEIFVTVIENCDDPVTTLIKNSIDTANEELLNCAVAYIWERILNGNKDLFYAITSDSEKSVYEFIRLIVDKIVVGWLQPFEMDGNVFALLLSFAIANTAIRAFLFRISPQKNVVVDYLNEFPTNANNELYNVVLMIIKEFESCHVSQLQSFLRATNHPAAKNLANYQIDYAKEIEWIKNSYSPPLELPWKSLQDCFKKSPYLTLQLTSTPFLFDNLDILVNKFKNFLIGGVILCVLADDQQFTEQLLQLEQNIQQRPRQHQQILYSFDAKTRKKSPRISSLPYKLRRVNIFPGRLRFSKSNEPLSPFLSIQNQEIFDLKRNFYLPPSNLGFIQYTNLNESELIICVRHKHVLDDYFMTIQSIAAEIIHAEITLKFENQEQRQLHLTSLTKFSQEDPVEGFIREILGNVDNSFLSIAIKDIWIRIVLGNNILFNAVNIHSNQPKEYEFLKVLISRIVSSFILDSHLALMEVVATLKEEDA